MYGSIHLLTGAIFFSVGIFFANKGIKFVTGGKLEKLEGVVVDIIREQDISDGKIANYLVIQYFNGFNYVTYQSTIGGNPVFKKIGDKVTLYRNTSTREVTWVGELFGKLLLGIAFMVGGISILSKLFI